MQVRVCATWSTVEWVEDQDGPCEEPLEDGGFCDPMNPWGSFEYTDQDRVIYTFDSLGEAAEWVVDFPGGVWDWCEGEAELQRDGRWKEVTGHVMDHEIAVFALADMLNHCGDRGKYVMR